jgi:hypothetical protein
VSLGVIRCNNNPVRLQGVGRRGHIKEKKKKKERRKERKKKEKRKKERGQISEKG